MMEKSLTQYAHGNYENLPFEVLQQSACREVSCPELAADYPEEMQWGHLKGGTFTGGTTYWHCQSVYLEKLMGPGSPWLLHATGTGHWKSYSLQEADTGEIIHCRSLVRKMYKNQEETKYISSSMSIQHLLLNITPFFFSSCEEKVFERSLFLQSNQWRVNTELKETALISGTPTYFTEKKINGIVFIMHLWRLIIGRRQKKTSPAPYANAISSKPYHHT